MPYAPAARAAVLEVRGPARLQATSTITLAGLTLAAAALALIAFRARR